MKLSKYKEIIANKVGEDKWKNFESTRGYLIYSSTEEEQLKAVQENGDNIQYINNPSEEVKLEAVKNNGYSIKYMNNPSKKLKIEAIKNTSYAIMHIKNPSEELQLLAVKENPLSIIDINNPTEKVIQEAANKIIYSRVSDYLLRHLENDLKGE